jgi:hypothetical protein
MLRIVTVIICLAFSNLALACDDHVEDESKKEAPTSSSSSK